MTTQQPNAPEPSPQRPLDDSNATAGTHAEPESSRRFILVWTLLTTLASLLLLILFSLVSVASESLGIDLPWPSYRWESRVEQVLSWSTAAAVVSLLQWIPLRRCLERAYRWPLVTTFVAAIAGLSLNPLFYLPFGLLLVGALQGVVLSDKARYVFVSAVGVFVSAVVGVVVLMLSYVLVASLVIALEAATSRDNPLLTPGLILMVVVPLSGCAAVYGLGTGLIADFVLRKDQPHSL